MSGRGFQFVGGQMLPIEDAPAQQGEFFPAALPAAASVEKVQPKPALRTASSAPAPAPKSKPEKPRDIVRAARQRIREIKAELRRMARLEKELAQLTRLVAAAEGKTIAPVRAIESARRTG